MAHFTLTRANLAAWAAGTSVPDTDFWSLDQKTYAAINGDAGGTWAPSAAIIIGGSGLNLTGPVTTSSTHTYSAPNAKWDGEVGLAAGGFTITGWGNTLTVDATTVFEDDVSIEQAGNFLTIGDGTNANEIQIANNAYGRVLSGGELVADAGSVVTLSGAVAISGTSNILTTLLSQVGAGQIAQRVSAGVDANTTYHPSTTDIVHIDNATLMVDRVYILGTTGAQSGSRMTIVNYDAVRKVTVTDALGAKDIIYLAGQYYCIEYFYDGTGWYPLNATKQ